LLVAVLIIGTAVLFLEKARPSTIGLTMANSKRTLLTTAVTLVYTVIVGCLVALFWKHLGHLRVEGDKIYFVGNIIPYTRIGPGLLCIMLLDQIATVALPEEIIYRGYFQSRLSYSWKPFYAILGSTILFALVHLDRPLMLLHIMLMASILPSVIVHCFANIAAVLFLKHIALS
jgi:membrane protease YdiL (CAAX protease family)